MDEDRVLLFLGVKAITENSSNHPWLTRGLEIDEFSDIAIRPCFVDGRCEKYFPRKCPSHASPFLSHLFLKKKVKSFICNL